MAIPPNAPRQSGPAEVQWNAGPIKDATKEAYNVYSDVATSAMNVGLKVAARVVASKKPNATLPVDTMDKVIDTVTTTANQTYKRVGGHAIDAAYETPSSYGSRVVSYYRTEKKQN